VAGVVGKVPGSAAEGGRSDYLTFKGNLRQTRYGWLRLTPAYSVHQRHNRVEHPTGATRGMRFKLPGRNNRYS